MIVQLSTFMFQLFFANQGSNYVCNYLDRSWNAVFFDQANITDQFPGNVSQANQYVNNTGAFDLQGSSVVANWFYNITGVNSGATYDPSPFNTLGLNVTGSGDGVTDVCSTFLLGPGDEREVKAGDIVRNQRVFLADTLENKRWDIFHAFKYLKSDTSLLTLGLSDDSTYQNFYLNEQASCVGLSEKVYDEIHFGNLSSASFLNSLMPLSCIADQYRKDVNYIYLTILQGDTISHSDSVYLDQIAWLDPFYYGDAVYSARVILKIDPSATGTTRSVEVAGEESTLAELTVKVYPNPAENILNIEIRSNNEQQNFSSHLIDVSGREVLFVNLNTGRNSIDIINLLSGVYILSIENSNGDIISWKKIILNK